MPATARARTDRIPAALRELTDRYDPTVFELGRRSARIRVEGAGPEAIDVVLDGATATPGPAETSRRADATLRADADAWERIATDLAGGMDAFRAGRLRVRQDLHLGVGFLAATAPSSGEGRLRFRRVETAEGALSISEAGAGPAVLLLHGLGATKVSMLPTLAGLAPGHRAIAVDLPGFGDSDKPILAAYDAPDFAKVMRALLDALGLDRADVVGNSMGGRVALELGLTAPTGCGGSACSPRRWPGSRTGRGPARCAGWCRSSG